MLYSWTVAMEVFVMIVPFNGGKQGMNVFYVERYIYNKYIYIYIYINYQKLIII